MADYLPPVVSELVAKTDAFRRDMLAAQRSMGAVEKAGGSSFDKLAKVGKAAFFGLGAAAIGFGALAVKGAEEQEAANARLQTALKNVGSTLTATSKPFEDAEAAARKLGFEDDQATDSMAKLATATRNPAKAIRDLALAENIARGRNIDLASATDLLVKVETGHYTQLGRLGVITKEQQSSLTSTTQATQLLTDLYGGQADAYSKTFAGRLATLRAETNELAENVGNFLIPKIEASAHAGNVAIEWLEKHTTAARALGVVVGGPLAVAMGAYLVQQARSVALSGAQLALKVPQFFLEVGAAIRGTTAAEVVLNATTLETNATMLAGAGVVGAYVTAATVGFQVERSRAQEATKEVHAHAESIDNLSVRLDVLKQQLKETQADDYIKKHSTNFPLPWDESVIDKQQHQIKALKGEIEATQKALDNEGKAAQRMSGVHVNMGGAMIEAADDAAQLTQKVDGIRNALSGQIAAQKSYKDSLSRVDDAAKSVTEAHRALDVAISKAVVDTKAVAAAQRELRDADESVTTAADRLTKAREKLADVEKGAAPRDLAEAQLRVSEAIRAQERAALGLKEKQESLRKLQFDSTRTADDYHSAQLDVADAQDGVTKANFDAQQAQEELTRLQRQGKAGSDELTQAQSDLAEAEKGLRTAQEQQQAAQDRITQANIVDPGLTDAVTAARGRLTDAEHGLRDAKDGVAASALAAADAEAKARDEMDKAGPAAAYLRDRLDEVGRAYPEALPAIRALEAFLPAALAAGSDEVLKQYRPRGSQIPVMDSGGWIPGPVGAPTPMIGHGGEFVVSRDMMRAGSGGAGSGGGGVTVIVQGSLIGGSPRQVADALAPHVRDAINRNAKGTPQLWVHP